MGNVGQPYSLHFLGHKLPSIKACGSPSPCLTIYKEKWKKNPYPPRIPNIYLCSNNKAPWKNNGHFVWNIRGANQYWAGRFDVQFLAVYIFLILIDNVCVPSIDACRSPSSCQTILTDSYRAQWVSGRLVWCSVLGSIFLFFILLYNI